MTVILIAKGQSTSGTSSTTTGWKSPWITMGGANALGLFVDVLSSTGGSGAKTLNVQVWTSMDGGASDAMYSTAVQITNMLAAGRFSVPIATLPFPQIRLDFFVTAATGTETTVFDATVNTATL